MDSKQILALDVGMKRTGLARASAVARLAEPLKTVPTEEVLANLQQLIKEYGIDTIVVGLPRDLHGHETQQTAWVRQWVDQLKAQLNMPIFWQDEALTSKLAEKYQRDKKNQDLDALSAALILQDFLEAPATEKVIA